MLSALDSEVITQSVPGIGLKTFKRHKDFRIVATQNPKLGAFSATRDRLSTKFMETFQVVEFPEFSAEELSKIAHQMAKKQKYEEEKIIEQISKFHNEWVKCEDSKREKIQSHMQRGDLSPYTYDLSVLRTKLLRCKAENKAFASYVNISRTFVQQVVEKALPHSRNKNYSRNGAILQPQPQSVVVNQLF